MLADDVATALYDMVQLLSAAKLPEAEQAEAIRKGVIGISQAPEQADDAPVQEMEGRPAGRGALPYWWEVCAPREGFRNPAHIDESLFAATLGGVFAGSAREEYLDPARFLSHTYFTENLTQMVRDIVSRMSGGEGPPVTEVQTPFGGGKDPRASDALPPHQQPRAGVCSAWRSGSARWSPDPSDARVLVFDGQEAGAEPVTKEDGASVSTIWGELAHQVGAGVYAKLVMDSDGRGVAPGNAVFRQVLEAASSCLILIDELVSYLVKLRFSNVRRTQNLYRQTIQFLQETLQLASNVPGVWRAALSPQEPPGVWRPRPRSAST